MCSKILCSDDQLTGGNDAMRVRRVSSAIVNESTPGAAEFVSVPKTGHSYQTFTSWEKSFNWPAGVFAETHFIRVI